MQNRDTLCKRGPRISDPGLAEVYHRFSGTPGGPRPYPRVALFQGLYVPEWCRRCREEMTIVEPGAMRVKESNVSRVIGSQSSLDKYMTRDRMYSKQFMPVGPVD